MPSAVSGMGAAGVQHQATAGSEISELGTAEKRNISSPNNGDWGKNAK